MGICCLGSGCAGRPCQTTCPTSTGETVGVNVGVRVGVRVGVLVGVFVETAVGVGVCANGTSGSGQTYAPRERVKAARVVKPRSIAMSHTITLGIPALKRFHVGDAAVMSSVKYMPQSLPANTCCGKRGLAMIESTGMLGRLPLLFAQVKDAQLAVQVTL